MNKRDFLKTGAAVSLAAMMPSAAMMAAAENSPYQFDQMIDPSGTYTLPPLLYDYSALEPHIDEQTMRLHHDKHHQGYVNGLNKATKMVKQAIEDDDYSLIKHWERELAFHGSGHFLHTIFWSVMGPKQGKMSTELTNYINKSFGSVDKFKSLFHAASKSVEGSGWGILTYQPYADRLVVLQAEKHHNLTQWISVPLLPVDVWEHAYYLKYQNNRGSYIDAFMKVVNWDAVSEQFSNMLRMYKS